MRVQSAANAPECHTRRQSQLQTCRVLRIRHVVAHALNCALNALKVPSVGVFIVIVVVIVVVVVSNTI